MPSSSTVSGAEIIRRLCLTGDTLNTLVQQLDVSARNSLSAQLGSQQQFITWPSVSWPASRALSKFQSLWQRTLSDIQSFAGDVYKQCAHKSVSCADYERHFISVVVTRILLEPVMLPANLFSRAARALQIGPSDVADLDRHGYCTFSGVLSKARIDAVGLHAEIVK